MGDQYRCEMSNAANIIGIINKIMFLILCLHAALRLRGIAMENENKHHLSDSITCFMVIPLCTVCNIFTLCNENWISILPLDDGRTMGFISIVVMTLSMICNHLMMQAQAKEIMRRASNVMRHSILGKAMNRIEIEKAVAESVKIKVEDEAPKEIEQRFSVPEIDVDQYEAVMIEAEEHDEDDINDVVTDIDHDTNNDDDDDDGDGDQDMNEVDNQEIVNKEDGSSELEELMEIHKQLKRESLEIMKGIEDHVNESELPDTQ